MSRLLSRKWVAAAAACLFVSVSAVGADNPGNIVDSTETSGSEESGSEIRLKRKIAIARFTNETRSGTTFLVDNSGDRIGKQASDILSARLAETNNFLMFERIDSDKTSQEQMLAGLQESGVSVDYLIVGSVSEFGRSTESDTGVFSRNRIQKAYAKVNVRLVDVGTGRIIYASEGAGEAMSEAKKVMGVGSSAGFDQSLTDRAISAAISQLTSNLVENMTSSPWKSYLLAEDQGIYIMAGGPSQGIKPGTELYLYEQGRQIKNPQTGTLITLPGAKIGPIDVIESVGEDEFSEVSYVTLRGSQLNKPLDSYYISDK
jgi:curli biogenesis system outer membrane secretion channel CsgG